MINSISAIISAINMYNDGLMKEESHAITISIMAENQACRRRLAMITTTIFSYEQKRKYFY